MDQRAIDSEDVTTPSMKPCPFCAEPINQEAKKCVRCREYLEKDRIGFKQKTLWDVISVLIVPITLAFLGWLFTLYQGNLEQSRAAAAAELQAITEANRANASLLEHYLDDMSRIFLEEDLEDENVQAVVRSRTVAVVRDLDSNRNSILISFLLQAGAFDWVFNRAYLVGADLVSINLSGGDLSFADLSKADLSKANLLKATLSNTDLRESNLSKANLSNAFLSGADLSGADLFGADLTEARYDADTIWPEGFDPIAAGAILEE